MLLAAPAPTTMAQAMPTLSPLATMLRERRMRWAGSGPLRRAECCLDAAA